MAAHYVKEIRHLQPVGPYRLGGLSFGGTVAFEMARQLHAAGQTVSLVALLDSDNLPPPPPNPDSPAVVGNLGFVSRRLRLHLAASRQIRPRARVSYFLEKAWTALWWVRQRLEAYYESKRHALPEALQIVNAADREASDRYVPGTYDGRVILFRASERRLTLLDDPYLGWRRFCRGDLEVVEVPGNHDSFIEEPQVRTLALELDARLRALQEAGGEAWQSETDNAEASSGSDW
jgi:thioesterase domain-containing protein